MGSEEHRPSKYYTPEEAESIVLDEGRPMHRSFVREDLDASVKDLLAPPDYLSRPDTAPSSSESPWRAAPGPMPGAVHHVADVPLHADMPGAAHYQEEGRSLVVEAPIVSEGPHVERSSRTHHISLPPESTGRRSFQEAQQEREEDAPPEAVKYGTVEDSAPGVITIGGAAGDAVFIDTGGAGALIDTGHRDSFRAAVAASPAETIRRDLGRADDGTVKLIHDPSAPSLGDVGPSAPDPDDVSLGAVFAERTWGDRSHRGHTGQYVQRKIERAISEDGADDVEGRSAGLGAKYGYRAGKYSALGVMSVAKGAHDLGAYGRILSEDVKSGVLTASEAKSALFSRTRSSIGGAFPVLGGLVRSGIAHEVADFRGSDDLGIQAIVKPKDAIVRSYRVWNTGRSLGRTTGKLFRKGSHIARGAVHKAVDAGRAVIITAKRIAATPIVKGGLILAAVLAVVMLLPLIVSAVVSVFSSLTLKGEDWELTQTYLYITELDARVQYDILMTDNDGNDDSDTVYGYYLNGRKVQKWQLEVYTDADLLLAYLDCKHDDAYTFRDVRDEISRLHAALHQLTTKRWVEEVQINPFKVIYIDHVDTYLSTTSTAAYLDAKLDKLLLPEQRERYDVLGEIGVYTMRQELASPFPGVDWASAMTSRFGWRIHPITHALGTHNALDIAMDYGTPIHACMDGTADVPAYSDSYGNYVRVVAPNGDYTLYAHMSMTGVVDGQEVQVGDIIGYVGSTGTSTGYHLHLEYHKDGHGLNPLFYVER